MQNYLASLALLLGLAGCQSPPATLATTPAAGAAPAAAPATGVATEAEARAAVARYVQTLPNAARYVPDSASVVGGGGSCWCPAPTGKTGCRTGPPSRWTA